MLGWIIRREEIIPLLLREKHIAEAKDCVSDTPDSMLDEQIEIKLTNNALDRPAQRQLARLIKCEKQKSILRCTQCDKDASTDVIFCDACLQW